MRITVIGTGYLGVTHAACMAELGFEVMGLDVDVEKVAALADGRVPFYEPGLQELMREQIAAGRLSFTSDYAELAAWAGDGAVHFVSVGTPQKKGEYAADMTYVDAAFDSIARAIAHQGRSLVVGKSTVPVGTAARIADRLAELAPNAEVAWNPEFLREGYAVQDTLHPDRLVIGVRSEQAEADLRHLYAQLLAEKVPLVVTDFSTAELVKVSANSFLAVKISFINAMAEVCEAAGADVMQLSQALSYDPRIGGRFLVPGLGFGGGCLPKDIRAFMARAGELGVDQALAFLKEVDAINMRRRARTVDLAREQCDGSLLGKRVAVWGAAFKPESDDIRDSPALNVAASIHLQGAQVTVYDPKATDNARKMFPTLSYADTAMEAAEQADVILHLTEWKEFRELDPAVVGGQVRSTRIIDGRNALDAAAWRAAGWTYRALGRP
ncbi:UDP-glucose/GDP-mannose dehydrogenase family protein [Catenulispora sp. NF23]|uniref:UDP-glucose 6-dehydrogenase n=1 Tax=Catenulispora pinistramenti TaxID=2705254 RepID=A0ABS5KLB5_9ACTN|nr:UDP-glucose/GDP-mannose dehydrogenase family protein [Catenulispora pinistramenti]MBS2532060.1 UDP-glucose/GDP-mannose dehydrogenase family protein [Catenulispora pinistramenti]MBS2546833.1 UDP-glucose/GDP-mannose dehydrogenase family protein [Catenulispora pinistramenti]